MPNEWIPAAQPSSSDVPAHAPTHAANGTDPVAINIGQVNGLEERLDNIPGAGNFVVGEILTPAPNGSNNAFYLAHTPASDKVSINYNGIEMVQGVSADYQISSNLVTFTFAPELGAKLTANYIKPD